MVYNMLSEQGFLQRCQSEFLHKKANQTFLVKALKVLALRNLILQPFKIVLALRCREFSGIHIFLHMTFGSNTTASEEIHHCLKGYFPEQEDNVFNRSTTVY